MQNWHKKPVSHKIVINKLYIKMDGQLVVLICYAMCF